MQLSEAVKIQPVLDYASGSADRTGDIIDTRGFGGVLFVVHFATIAAGAVTSIKAQQGAASDLSDAADLEGSGLSVAADDDNEVKYIEIRHPQERYVRLVVDKDAANATAESAVAYLFNPDNEPVTHASDVAGESHHAPDEGTA